jgi:hypothetical protein
MFMVPTFCVIFNDDSVFAELLLRHDDLLSALKP